MREWDCRGCVVVCQHCCNLHDAASHCHESYHAAGVIETRLHARLTHSPPHSSVVMCKRFGYWQDTISANRPAQSQNVAEREAAFHKIKSIKFESRSLVYSSFTNRRINKNTRFEFDWFDFVKSHFHLMLPAHLHSDKSEEYDESMIDSRNWGLITVRIKTCNSCEVENES